MKQIYKVHFRIRVQCGGPYRYFNGELTILAENEKDAIKRFKDNATLEFEGPHTAEKVDY